MSTYLTDASINSGNLTQSEIHLYGSSRLGIYTIKTNVQSVNNPNAIVTFERANKFFELSNHLGNVLVTISDKKIGHDAGNGTIDYYTADVATATDYTPFGMGLSGRKYTASSSSYRYGFNGKENDNEVKGQGNQQDYGMRIYDPRLGRFLSVDPLTIKYPELTPYQFASNRPIDGIDLDGAEYMRYPAALQIRLSMQSVDGKIKRVEYGQLVPKNLPQFYKSIGAVTQQKFETAFKNTQYKIDQLNPPDFPAANRAQAVEALLQWVAKTAVTFTPEVKAHEEMTSQIGFGKAAVNLIDAASSLNLLPAQFASDLNFKENLMNYVLDGTLSQSGYGEKLKNYNKVIQAVGGEILANEQQVLGGTYKRKTKEITAIHTAPRGLDFQTMGAPKIIGVETKKVDAPYQQALDDYNKSKEGCVNCTTVGSSTNN